MAYVWSKSRVIDEVKGRDTGKIHRRMNFYGGSRMASMMTGSMTGLCDPRV